MVRDLDFMKGMLNVFLTAETTFISTKRLAEAGYPIDSEQGQFHYLQLVEQGFISNKDLITNDVSKLGYMRMKGWLIDIGSDVRLTAAGQEFAQSLQEPSVYEKLKDFSNAPLDVLKDVGVDVFKAVIKKKLGVE
ncbi:TPA: hypothetical protein ACY3LK_004963 [Citrobacter braakii]|uniref:hypothetical protein n=1 Tax=Citrobacter braakii TaxID=57706 RepID=UPI001A31E915|nr:hypothetical protein [Citrobacter braakii]MEB0965193.1 hypothetical protein [Citrobacter braakii]